MFTGSVHQLWQADTVLLRSSRIPGAAARLPSGFRPPSQIDLRHHYRQQRHHRLREADGCGRQGGKHYSSAVLTFIASVLDRPAASKLCIIFSVLLQIASPLSSEHDISGAMLASKFRGCTALERGRFCSSARDRSGAALCYEFRAQPRTATQRQMSYQFSTTREWPHSCMTWAHSIQTWATPSSTHSERWSGTFSNQQHTVLEKYIYLFQTTDY